MLSLSERSLESYKKEYSYIPLEDLEYIAKSDPTSTDSDVGDYARWAIIRYSNFIKKNNSKLVLTKDELKAIPSLLQKSYLYFNKHKSEKSCLDTLNTVSDLKDYLDSKNFISVSDIQCDPTKRSKFSKAINSPSSQIICNNEYWIAFIPTSYDSMRPLLGFTICTTKENKFTEYTKNGNLYICIHKPTGILYSFSFVENSFVTEDDELILDFPNAESLSLALAKFCIQDVPNYLNRAKLNAQFLFTADQIFTKAEQNVLMTLMDLYPNFLPYLDKDQIINTFHNCPSLLSKIPLLSFNIIKQRIGLKEFCRLIKLNKAPIACIKDDEFKMILTILKDDPEPEIVSNYLSQSQIRYLANNLKEFFVLCPEILNFYSDSIKLDKELRDRIKQTYRKRHSESLYKEFCVHLDEITTS